MGQDDVQENDDVTLRVRNNVRKKMYVKNVRKNVRKKCT